MRGPFGWPGLWRDRRESLVGWAGRVGRPSERTRRGIVVGSGMAALIAANALGVAVTARLSPEVPFVSARAWLLSRAPSEVSEFNFLIANQTATLRDRVRLAGTPGAATTTLRLRDRVLVVDRGAAAVYSVSTGGTLADQPAPARPSDPRRVLVTDGAALFSVDLTSGTGVRLDPVTLRPAAPPVRLGPGLTEPTGSAGTLWLASRRTGSVVWVRGDRHGEVRTAPAGHRLRLSPISGGVAVLDQTTGMTSVVRGTAVEGGQRLTDTVGGQVAGWASSTDGSFTAAAIGGPAPRLTFARRGAGGGSLRIDHAPCAAPIIVGSRVYLAICQTGSLLEVTIADSAPRTRSIRIAAGGARLELFRSEAAVWGNDVDGPGAVAVRDGVDHHIMKYLVDGGEPTALLSPSPPRGSGSPVLRSTRQPEHDRSSPSPRRLGAASSRPPLTGGPAPGVPRPNPGASPTSDHRSPAPGGSPAPASGSPGVGSRTSHPPGSADPSGSSPVPAPGSGRSPSPTPGPSSPSASPSGSPTPDPTPSVIPRELPPLLVDPPLSTVAYDFPIETPLDVATVFYDHPDDTATILQHGFVHAHYRVWQSPTSDDPYRIAQATILQFDTPENAAAVHSHFHKNSQADGRQQFAVPAQLTEGYGDQVVLSDGSVGQGVNWRVGSYVISVAMSSYAPLDMDQTIAWAVSQDDALGVLRQAP